MNYIHGEDRNQMRIESLESFASPDSEVRVIDKIVDAMDIESLGFKLGNNKDSGRPKFDSKDLLKLYIYGYFNGIRSSRKLAKQCVINKEVIWLIKDIKPKYRVIADFRKDNIDALVAREWLRPSQVPPGVLKFSSGKLMLKHEFVTIFFVK